MTVWSAISDLVSFLADLLTIVASLIAIYIFIAKRDQLKMLLQSVVNFVHHSSLAEIRQKLEVLNGMSCNDAKDAPEIVNILHDICGQIEGNPMLQRRLSDLTAKVRRATSGTKVLTEPAKRSIISYVRERLKHIEADNYANSVEGGR